ncbi:FAD/NAD(P)-binding domain-containing protein [Ophiobolus disseminans]|uniref:FAD/NAD(P)-binding domain-containing protein n=1 Tax=Ophiobolus disseminans TaxID=1469910 RepID=A0A6A7AII4_9PLEO|nr:FAD/NAD(P)-binding domain-containing protein [Ophiobolus disseminans]
MALRPQIVDAIIIGAGPAGLNAALAFARTRSTALVFDSKEYRNEGIKHMHTVASRDHQDPKFFRSTAREQIESRYDTIWFQHANIIHAAKKAIGKEQYDGFEVKDSEGKAYEGRKLILATGSKDILLDIPGYKENWPEHIYQCLACDGFEQRGTPIGILSFDSPMYAHMAQMATAFDKRITIFSNGPVSPDEPIQKALKVAHAFGATLDERKIVRLVNNGPSHTDGVTVEFESGEPVTLGFLVHKPATVNRAQHLIEQLGVETVDLAMGGHVKIVNPMFNSTSVRGVFAGGDTMVMMKQVVIAMAEGAKAAVGAGMELGVETSGRVVGEYEAGGVQEGEEKEKAVENCGHGKMSFLPSLHRKFMAKLNALSVSATSPHPTPTDSARTNTQLFDEDAPETQTAAQPLVSNVVVKHSTAFNSERASGMGKVHQLQFVQMVKGLIIDEAPIIFTESKNFKVITTRVNKTCFATPTGFCDSVVCTAMLVAGSAAEWRVLEKSEEHEYLADAVEDVWQKVLARAGGLCGECVPVVNEWAVWTNGTKKASGSAISFLFRPGRWGR